jgi:hypothetical protein
MGSVYPNDERINDHYSWFDEHRIEVLLLNELVRSRIARYTHGGRTRAGVVDEIEKAFGTGTTAGFMFGISVAGSVFLQGARGMRPGQKRTDNVPWPVGRTIVAVLCSLANRNQELADVAQGGDGCTLAAKVSFSALSVPAILTVSIRRNESGSVVEAGTQMPSGVIDWGKSKRILERLHTDVPHFVSLDDYL